MRVKREPCPKCGELRNVKGLTAHLKYCGVIPDVEKVKYPKQKAIMSPNEYAKFLRKAEATI